MTQGAKQGRIRPSKYHKCQPQWGGVEDNFSALTLNYVCTNVILNVFWLAVEGDLKLVGVWGPKGPATSLMLIKPWTFAQVG